MPLTSSTHSCEPRCRLSSPRSSPQGLRGTGSLWPEPTSPLTTMMSEQTELRSFRPSDKGSCQFWTGNKRPQAVPVFCYFWYNGNPISVQAYPPNHASWQALLLALYIYAPLIRYCTIWLHMNKNIAVIQNI